MTIENVHDSADSGESAQVEFKRTTGTLAAAAKTVCGMLNGEGGSVLIGVRDDGSVLGQEVADRTRREVARSDGAFRMGPSATGREESASRQF